jgi:hypothetical protein
MSFDRKDYERIIELARIIHHAWEENEDLPDALNDVGKELFNMAEKVIGQQFTPYELI